jgi:hypothetical protein
LTHSNSDIIEAKTVGTLATYYWRLRLQSQLPVSRLLWEDIPEQPLRGEGDEWEQDGQSQKRVHCASLLFRRASEAANCSSKNKQHLRINRFIVNYENTVKTKITCAVTTYVLVAIVKRNFLNLFTF